MENSAAAGIKSSMPPRDAKHRRKTKSSSKKQRRSSARQSATTTMGRAMTQQELAQHVAHQYLHGSGGILRERTLKSEKFLQDSDHDEYLQTLNRRPALVLNADYQPLSHLPLSLWHWQDAVKAVFGGKVTVVDVYPEAVIRAANLEIPLPSVIALNEYVPQFHKRPAFTKRNVFLRDEYRCQYCSHFFHTRDLSLDHVVPRSQGGRLSWENAVTSCHKCNGRKGSLSVNQLRSVGMRLVREPFVPTQFQLASLASRMLPRRVHPTWAPYLGIQHEPASGGKAQTRQQMTEEEYYLDDVE